MHFGGAIEIEKEVYTHSPKEKKNSTEAIEMYGNNAEEITADYLVQYGMQPGFLNGKSCGREKQNE